MPGCDLLGLVTAQVVRDLSHHPLNNVCLFRFPERPTRWTRIRTWFTNRIRILLERANVITVSRWTLTRAEAIICSLARISNGLGETYAHLADDLSRSTMVEVLAYRVLGSEHVQLSINNKKYWDSFNYIESHLDRGLSTYYSPLLKTYLHSYDLNPTGLPISLYNLPIGVYNVFIAEQYACRGEHGAIEAKQGDVVIDGGGCWGDTALYFANRVGPEGRVISFEFESDNLRVFQDNLNRNPILRERIIVQQVALWDVPGESLGITANGPGTRVVDTPTSAARVLTTTIDRLVQDGVASRVDFIKLDIEGAELPALLGAEETLRKFRPTLAVAVYHELQDFVRIPAYLAGLDLGYKFYLRHITIHAEETVLYAVAGSP